MIERIPARATRAAAAILAAAALSAVAAGTAGASSTAWVSAAAPSAPYNTCEHPGFQGIQAALGSTPKAVHVCKGTYVEQVQISQSVKITAEAGAKVKLPVTPKESGTPCDSAKAQDIVVICGAETVKITGLTVEGPLEGPPHCSLPLFFILVGGGADLALRQSSVLNVAPNPINGCQIGTGVEIGRGGQVGIATLSKDTVSGYNKNGITVSEEGSKANITGVTVTSAPTSHIAQNGIQVSFGAFAKITKSTITGNECDLSVVCGEEALTQTQSTGVLFYGAAAGSSITKSIVAANDIGVYHEDLLATEPVSPQVVVSGNTLTGNRWEGVVLGAGLAEVSKNTIAGPGNVGIMLYQEKGASYGPKGTGARDTISGMTKWGVEGLSDNDPSDMFGSFAITRSKISGNPGPTVPESIFSNNEPKLQILVDETDS